MWEFMGTMHDFRPTLGTQKDPTSMLSLAASRHSSVLGPEFDSPSPVWLATCLPDLLDIFSRTAPSPAPRKVYRGSCSRDTLSGQVVFL